MAVYGYQGTYGYHGRILNEQSPFLYTEAYKKLRTNFRFLAAEENMNKIIVTSSVPEEGKTTVAINLAAVLAESGADVLLLDCDLRNPSVHKYIGENDSLKSGLVSFLEKEKSIDADNICRNSQLNISYIPVGKVPSNPAEMLGLKRMEELIEEAGKKYDFVICDTPPVGVVTDAALLSRCFDGVLFVIRQNYTTRNEVHAAKENLDRVHARIIGSVLNQFDISMDVERKSSYGHYYGYGKNNI